MGATMEPDYAAFLRETLPLQTQSMASHTIGGRRVWLKKAGPRNPRWRYLLLGAIAGVLRLDVLKPVMNLGGQPAITHEARRLAELGALGLCVPKVLALQPDGLLISDLGEPDAPADTLLAALAGAAREGAGPLLLQWQRGIDAIALVHARGSYLSQAFARNLVDRADGSIGYVDFEDDPGSTLGLAQCQARDWLSYVQSSALHVMDAGALDLTLAHWHAALASEAPEVRESLRQTARRMGWLRGLPEGERWGRDTARLRAAALFMTATLGAQSKQDV